MDRIEVDGRELHDDVCIVTQTSKRVAERLGASLPVSLFRALADPNRVALVAWLAAQRSPKTVSEIASGGCCPVDFSVVSRHLHTLHDAGIVDAERHGREVHYRLATATLARTLRGLADLLDRCCPPAEESNVRR